MNKLVTQNTPNFVDIDTTNIDTNSLRVFYILMTKSGMNIDFEGICPFYTNKSFAIKQQIELNKAQRFQGYNSVVVVTLYTKDFKLEQFKGEDNA